MLHKSNITLLCCAFFILGTGFFSIVHIPAEWVIGLSIAAGAGIAFFQSPKVRLMLALMLFFSLAFGRQMMLPTYTTNSYDQWLTFFGVVIKEPELLLDSQRFVVSSTQVQGKIQVKMPLHPRVAVGDKLELNCTLRKPEPFDGFRYDRYLERYQISSLCYYPGITVVGHENGWYQNLFAFKKKMTINFQHALSPPENTVLLGAFFGMKRAVPEHIMNAFRTTGTSHLLVISGLHVSLFTMIIISVLKQFSLSRKMVVYGVMFVLVVYVVFTGAQPSAVRAAIFGIVLLISELVGRRNSSLRLLVLAAALMLLYNPLLLLYDAGWQLSFLATSGIIVFSKRLEVSLSWFPNLFNLRAVLSTSIAAIISTTPIIAYNFHTFSPVALLANLILVPLMPLVMMGGMLVITISVFSPVAAAWIALPLYFLIHTMIWIVSFFAALPFTTVLIGDFNPLLLLLMMCALLFFGYLSIRHQRNER